MAGKRLVFAFIVIVMLLGTIDSFHFDTMRFRRSNFQSQTSHNSLLMKVESSDGPLQQFKRAFASLLTGTAVSFNPTMLASNAAETATATQTSSTTSLKSALTEYQEKLAADEKKKAAQATPTQQPKKEAPKATTQKSTKPLTPTISTTIIKKETGAAAPVPAITTAPVAAEAKANKKFTVLNSVSSTVTEVTPTAQTPSDKTLTKPKAATPAKVEKKAATAKPVQPKSVVKQAPIAAPSKKAETPKPSPSVKVEKKNVNTAPKLAEEVAVDTAVAKKQADKTRLNDLTNEVRSSKAQLGPLNSEIKKLKNELTKVEKELKKAKNDKDLRAIRQEEKESVSRSLNNKKTEFEVLEKRILRDNNEIKRLDSLD